MKLIYLCSIQTKSIHNAQNGNLQTFPLATARLVFVKGLFMVNTVSSLMSFIKWRNSFKTEEHYIQWTGSVLYNIKTMSNNGTWLLSKSKQNKFKPDTYTGVWVFLFLCLGSIWLKLDVCCIYFSLAMH
jgi:hypothetical protein